jgi:epoxyqueuosine reductase
MIYGCDICQIVCPYNSEAAETKEAVFAPRPEFINPDIEELSSLTEEEFKNRFGNSSIGELDYGLFKRNIGIAAQNVFKDTWQLRVGI